MFMRQRVRLPLLGTADVELKENYCVYRMQFRKTRDEGVG